jgi:hypothetical protein
MVGPEYQELSSIWESVDNNRGKKNSLIIKLCMIEEWLQTLMTAADSSVFAARVIHKVPIGGIRNNVQ